VTNHKFIAATTLIAIASAAALIANPPAPPPMSSVIPADDLVAAAKQYVQELEAATADEKTFTASGDKIARDANTLIVIALVLSKHDSQHALKSSAAALIAPAKTLAKAKDLAAAQADVAKLKSALEGKAEAVAEPNWEKLASLGKVMTQVTNLNTKLRNSLRRLDPRKTDENARNATVLAAIGQSIIYDTHEVKDDKLLPQWYSMSAEMRDAAAELSRAVRAGDKDRATAASTRIQKNCDACHEVFGQ
jgi:hypothetical protein